LMLRASSDCVAECAVPSQPRWLMRPGCLAFGDCGVGREVLCFAAGWGEA